MVNYIFYDLNSPTGRKVTGTELVKIAREYLSINKKLHKLDLGMKSTDITDVRDAWIYLENIDFKVEKTQIPKYKQYIVVDQYLESISSIGGTTKQDAERIAREANKIATDKSHRAYSLFKGRKFKVEKFTREI